VLNGLRLQARGPDTTEEPGRVGGGPHNDQGRVLIGQEVDPHPFGLALVGQVDEEGLPIHGLHQPRLFRHAASSSLPPTPPASRPRPVPCLPFPGGIDSPRRWNAPCLCSSHPIPSVPSPCGTGSSCRPCACTRPRKMGWPPTGIWSTTAPGPRAAWG